MHSLLNMKNIHLSCFRGSQIFKTIIWLFKLISEYIFNIKFSVDCEKSWMYKKKCIIYGKNVWITLDNWKFMHYYLVWLLNFESSMFTCSNFYAVFPKHLQMKATKWDKFLFENHSSCSCRIRSPWSMLIHVMKAAEFKNIKINEL